MTQLITPQLVALDQNLGDSPPMSSASWQAKLPQPGAPPRLKGSSRTPSPASKRLPRAYPAASPSRTAAQSQ
ncbi:hypothetical protein AHiyo8_31890 [Arthrobacter sp. Hiyo8]|nr:hypothetical protein AHiyo8_31890 [Arthrobacter sp. Hiyo8]